MTSNEYTLQQILEVAKSQKNILVVILASFAVGFSSAFFIPPNIAGLMTLGLSLVEIYFVYKLTIAVRSSFAWVYMILMFLPLISVVALLHLNQKATKILRANDLKVGLMGVSSSDLERIQSRI
jgi:hypothetical protein